MQDKKQKINKIISCEISGFSIENILYGFAEAFISDVANAAFENDYYVPCCPEMRDQGNVKVNINDLLFHREL